MRRALTIAVLLLAAATSGCAQSDQAAQSGIDLVDATWAPSSVDGERLTVDYSSLDGAGRSTAFRVGPADDRVLVIEAIGVSPVEDAWVRLEPVEPGATITIPLSELLSATGLYETSVLSAGDYVGCTNSATDGQICTRFSIS